MHKKGYRTGLTLFAHRAINQCCEAKVPQVRRPRRVGVGGIARQERLFDSREKANTKTWFGMNNPTEQSFRELLDSVGSPSEMVIVEGSLE